MSNYKTGELAIVTIARDVTRHSSHEPRHRDDTVPVRIGPTPAERFRRTVGRGAIALYVGSWLFTYHGEIPDMQINQTPMELYRKAIQGNYQPQNQQHLAPAHNPCRQTGLN